MKIDRKTQVPNLVVYAVMYATIFGISIWLLIAHKENPTNWFLYVAMIGSVLAGLVKFIVGYLISKKTPSKIAEIPKAGR